MFYLLLNVAKCVIFITQLKVFSYLSRVPNTYITYLILYLKTKHPSQTNIDIIF